MQGDTLLSLRIFSQMFQGSIYPQLFRMSSRCFRPIYVIMSYSLNGCCLQVFPSSFSIAALIGAAAIRGRVGKLGWAEEESGGRRRKLSEENNGVDEVEAKRQRRDDDEEQDDEGGASPPRQVEVCSPLLAARRLLRDPKELLAIATEERRGEVPPARFNFSLSNIRGI